MNAAPSSLPNPAFGARIQSSPIYDPFGLFGPLGKNYCIYFYVIAVFCFIAFLLSLVTLVGEIVTFNKTSKLYHTVFVAVINFILYLEARILYNMCLHSI